MVREMAANPNIPGPAGEEYRACTDHAQRIIASLKKVNTDIGVAKMEMLTTAMDFMRNVHGVPGKHGCVVCCYLCPACNSCPRHDYHWTVVRTGKGQKWSCCKCGEGYQVKAMNAYLFDSIHG